MGEGFGLYGPQNVIIVSGCGCCGSPFMGGPFLDNARLIAAAPELLEALLEYMSQFGQALEANDIPFGPAQQSADAKARAAIAKAEGES